MTPTSDRTSELPDHSVTHDAGNTTVYLLHGIYGAKEYWRYQTERLVARGYRVIAWDAPGYGFSSLPDEFDFDAVADAGARLIRATAKEKNVLFGHSMGGQITPRVLAKVRPTVKVSAIVITATIGYFGNRTKEEQAEFVSRRSSLPPGVDSYTAQLAIVNGMLAPASAGEEVELVRRVASMTSPKTVQAAVRAVQQYPEVEAVAMIKAIDVPALLVAGALDQTGHPAGMRRVADMIPGAQMAIVVGSGHYPWAENPVEFNRHLDAFLDLNAPAT